MAKIRFDELTTAVKTVSFDELRVDEPDYFEAVVLNVKLPSLTLELEKFFGVCVWPSKNALTAKINDVIKDCGGIMPNQTLYFWSEEGETIFAMLWPWRDGMHITLKISKKE